MERLYACVIFLLLLLLSQTWVSVFLPAFFFSHIIVVSVCHVVDDVEDVPVVCDCIGLKLRYLFCILILLVLWWTSEDVVITIFGRRAGRHRYRSFTADTDAES